MRGFRECYELQSLAEHCQGFDNYVTIDWMGYGLALRSFRVRNSVVGQSMDNFERTQFFLGLCRGPPSPLALCMTRLQSKSHRIAALQGPSFGLYERLLCPPCVSRSCHIDLSPPGCQLLCTIFHQMSWHLLLDQNGRNGVDRACQITGFWCAFGALVG